MKREQAVDAYMRTGEWSKRMTVALLDDLRSRGARDPIPHLLHNWGHMGGREPYKSLHREYQYRQRRIWDTAARLSRSFARHF